MRLLSFVVLGLAACLVAAEQARFDNYRVYSIVVETKEQLKMLKDIEETSDSVSPELFHKKIDSTCHWNLILNATFLRNIQYSFWESPGKISSTVELIVPPHKFAEFGEITKNFELKTRLNIEDLQKWV